MGGPFDTQGFEATYPLVTFIDVVVVMIGGIISSTDVGFTVIVDGIDVVVAFALHADVGIVVMNVFINNTDVVAMFNA